MIGAFRLGQIELDRPVMLAPMSGVTDLPFRRLAARFGADVVVSEMVASEALTEGDSDMVLRTAGEGIFPHVVQLAGREPHWMAAATRLAEAAGADIIDINMGCPAKRVTTGWSGAALMRDLDLAVELIAATVKATALPVTLKMRLGWDRASLNAGELARRAEAEGVQLITVHGRTRDQFYEGSADWHAIRAVREATRLPLIANGDCVTLEAAEAMLAASGADGVMIGRGAQGRPWFPGAVARHLRGAAAIAPPEGAALADLVAEHYQAMLDHYGVGKGIRAARKHLSWYLDELEAGAGAGAGSSPMSDPVPRHPLRPALLTATDPGRVAGLIRDIFSAAPARRAA